jgi:RNase P subunit RPR2
MPEIIYGTETCHQCQVILPYGFRWNNRIEPVVNAKADDVIRVQEPDIILECPSCGAQHFMKLEKTGEEVTGLKFDHYVW